MKDKKKLTINALAMGNLKQRRKQYTILVIGIVLAMVFSSGIMFFVSCWQTSIQESKDRIYGRQDEIYIKATDFDFEEAMNKGYISEYALAHTIGFAYKNEEKNDLGTAVAWLDDKATELYYPYLFEGRLPEKDGEIAIEKQTLMQLGFEEKKPGEQITLNMKIPDGKGFSDKTEKRTYTLVGIVINKKTHVCDSENPETTAYMPSAYVYKGEQTAVGGKELLVGFVSWYSYEARDKEEYYNLTADCERIPTSYRDSNDGANGSDIGGTMLYTIGFAVILTIVSCLAIVNSFANNLRERKRQIGMLRAVGATKRQIISIYAREAFIISLITAPLSVFISYFGVKLIAKLMGEDFIFIPQIWVLAAGAAVSVICVMCAALIPLISVSKSSPMQAIRNVDYTRKLRRRKIRSQKSFNVSSLLAKRNITLARSRQVVVSVILSITIFCSCYGFSAISHELDETGYSGYEYELWDNASYISLIHNETLDYRGYSDNDIAELMSSGYFESVFATKSCMANILTEEFNDYQRLIAVSDNFYGIYEYVDKGVTAENYREKVTGKFSEGYNELRVKYNIRSHILPATFTSINDEYFEKIKDIVDGEINLDKINSGEEIVLIAPQKIGIYIDDYGMEGYTFLEADAIDDSRPPNEEREYIEIQECTYKVGDEIDLSIISSSLKDENQFVKTDRKVKIGAILNDEPDGFGGMFPYIDSVGILTTNTASTLFAPEIDYVALDLKAKGEFDDEANAIISPFVENIALSITDGSFRNNYEFSKKTEQQLKIFIFGMICVIALFLAICGSVVNNALTARIREGKREIGTLRAVGADLKVLSSSYIRQLLVIFGWGYGIGFGLYIGVYWLLAILNKALEWGEEMIEFRIFETILMCAVLFLICAVNLTLKIKQEMKHSIVENIREL